MLAIRMQRLGRKGHPTYRVVVQDVRQTPTSGKYVALLGSYDPHAKTTTLIKEKAEFYLTHGAQPSERVARLFSSEGITLPSWVKQPSDHTRTIRHSDKLRKNRPAEPVAAAEPAAEEVEKAAEVSEESAEADVTDTPEATTAEPATEPATEETSVVEADVAETEVPATEEPAVAEAPEEVAAEESTDEAETAEKPAEDSKKA